MAVGEGGIAGIPTVVQSNCIYFDDTIVHSVLVTLEGVETDSIRVDVGTSATITGTIIWQDDITHSTGTNVILTNPNKALFWRTVGVAPSTITKFKMKYTN